MQPVEDNLDHLPEELKAVMNPEPSEYQKKAEEIVESLCHYSKFVGIDYATGLFVRGLGPFTKKRVRQHFNGEIVAAATTSRDGKVEFVALDMSEESMTQEKSKWAMSSFVSCCKHMNVPVVVMIGSSGYGYVAFTQFESSVPFWAARALYIGLSVKAGISKTKGVRYVWPAKENRFCPFVLPCAGMHESMRNGTCLVDNDSLEWDRYGIRDGYGPLLDSKKLGHLEAKNAMRIVGICSGKQARVVAGNELSFFKSQSHLREFCSTVC